MNVEALRAETPVSERVLHFNNAGAALMPRRVMDAVVAHLELEALAGGYEAHEREAARVEGVYDSIARLINCRRDELALVEHATRAWDQAFYAVPLGPGDRILTSVAEYGANFVAYLQVAGRTGAEVTVVPNDEHGQISVGALREMMDDRVRLVSLNHVPTNGGLVNPAEAVGRVAREAGALFLLDACQSVGQLPVDVESIGCDMLSATGRKFLRGPRGTGFLYVRSEALDRLRPLTVDHYAAEWVARDRYELRPDARRFETWEKSYALLLGLGAAVDYALELGQDAIWERIRALAGLLRGRLAELPRVATHDLGEVKCGIVTFAVDGVDPLEVKRRLAGRGINIVAVGAASARIDMDGRGLDALCRASVHCYNTEAEVERFCAEVASLR